MAKVTTEETQEPEHSNGANDSIVNVPVPLVGRNLTREEALDRTFEKNKELYERLAQFRT